jgi:hypothetical protein
MPVSATRSTPTLTEAVREAVEAMTWLQTSDAGLIAVAYKYAETIDQAGDVKVIGWVGPHLVNALRALGGSPTDRLALRVDKQPTGALARLRAERWAAEQARSG